eukprot:1170324-Prymnesium_polylepis.1
MLKGGGRERQSSLLKDGMAAGRRVRTTSMELRATCRKASKLPSPLCVCVCATVVVPLSRVRLSRVSASDAPWAVCFHHDDCFLSRHRKHTAHRRLPRPARCRTHGPAALGLWARAAQPVRGARERPRTL